MSRLFEFNSRPEGPLVVSYGGGNNSVAMLLEMASRNIIPRAILFADPGHEWRHTYAYIANYMTPFLRRVGFPQITVVSRRVTMPGVRKRETLGEECIRLNTLPGAAFRSKTCSVKHKTEPQHDWLKRQGWVKDLWYDGKKVVSVIGYHADEPHRVNNIVNKQTPEQVARYSIWAPLTDWEMGQAECEQRILSEGWPLPGKSACTFCPFNTIPDWERLRETDPDAFAFALKMEAGAQDRILDKENFGLMKRQPQGRKHLHQWVADNFCGKEDDDEMPCECVG